MYVLNVAKHVRRSWALAILQGFCRSQSFCSRCLQHAVALAALPPASSPFDVFLSEYLRIFPLRLSV